MPDLRIERWSNRYRLPADAPNDRARLDGVLRVALGSSMLESALERAGVHSDGEICVRRLDAFIRLDRAAVDESLAAAWSVALADAIAELVLQGGPDVVQFTSRHAALLDMACGVARDDLSNAWAWRQVGIWEHEEVFSGARARARAIDALGGNASAATAVVAAVSRTGLLGALARGVPATTWLWLARRVLQTIGAREETLAIFSAPSTDAPRIHDVHEGVPDDDARWSAVVARIVDGSEIRRAAERLAVGELPATAFAALAMVECEPDVARSDAAARVVSSIAARAATRPIAAADAHSRGGETSGAAVRAGAPDEDSRIAPRDERIAARTNKGGLLFLVHALSALDLPSTIAADTRLSERSLRWSLHLLAMRLGRTDAGDAAALAFAGLSPAARPLPLDGPPATDIERAAIAAYEGPLCAWIRERGGALSGKTDAELLRRTIDRTAMVVADPGWIELHFALADASTEVRRAGLDLDPGWVPWLGVVLRFVYA